MSTTTKWLAGTTAVLGLWLIAAPFVFGVSGTGLWNAVIVGSMIAIVGGYNWYLTTRGEEVNVAGASFNALLGLWVIAAPFLFDPGTSALWNDVIVGAVVASLAGYNAYAANNAKERSAQPA